MIDFLKKLDEGFSKAVRIICTILMAMIFIMFILNVFVRFVPVYNFTQLDDWIQFCLIWMIFLGSQELVRTRNHFVVDFLAERIRNSSLKRILRVIVCTIELTTYAVVAGFGFVWVAKSNSYMQSIPWMQVRWMYLAIPFSAVFMTLYSFRDLLHVLKSAK